MILWATVPACREADARLPVKRPKTLIRDKDFVEIPNGSPLRGKLVVRTIVARPIRRSLEAPAHVKADPARLARITPPLAGRVERILVRFGDPVKAGEPVLTIDSPDLVAAQTDYLRARSALAQSEKTRARQQGMASHGVGAEREVEQAGTDADLAKRELERSEARLRLYGLSPGTIGRALTVRSPVAGRVVDFHVAAGEYHSDLSDVLMTVADLSTVWVTANILEKSGAW